MTPDIRIELRRIKSIRKKLSKIKVGLPKKVEFHYSKGVVECFPKERKWVISLNGKIPVTHIISKEHRNDVTKYKARHFLKLAILGILRHDKIQQP